MTASSAYRQEYVASHSEHRGGTDGIRFLVEKDHVGNMQNALENQD